MNQSKEYNDLDKPFEFNSTHRRILWGAVFLMATSSIGPAFLTQTAVFTEQFLASFAFAILASVIIDIGAQINIWRVITVVGKGGQDIANDVFKGLGTFIAILIAIGGLAFNIGNVAGAGLGLNAIFGIDVRIGAGITGVLAILIFVVKNAQKVVDIITQILGVLMIAVVAYVMVLTKPPVLDAAQKMIVPDDINKLIVPVITLVGGTVGGYITFAGAHRLLEAGIKGKHFIPFVNRAAISGILTTGVMRTFLFLAVLGVVVTGYTLNPENPPASVFEQALGPIGKQVFGVVLFAAALSSVIGCAYTSTTFIQSLHPKIKNHKNLVIITFIVISSIVFLTIGKPVKLLIIAGALNGLILPIILTTILIASRKKSIVGDYKHPMWMIVLGAIAVITTLIAGIFSLQGLQDLWNN